MLPIENSPPGIQTIPGGAGRGPEVELLTVGVKVSEAADRHDPQELVEAAVAGLGFSDGRDERNAK